MNGRRVLSLLTTLLLLGSLLPLSALARPVEQGTLDKIEALVLQELNEKGQADFFVWMTEKADLSPAYQLQTKLEKGRFVYETLVATADRTQASLRRYLDGQGADYQAFYIANKVLVRGGDYGLLLSIAARPDVASITANHPFQLQEPVEKNPAPASTEAVEANITFVKAPDVWTMGYSGQGTVMAGNDTGLDETHPTIARHYRGCVDPPTCSTWDHNYNWWDATDTYPTNPYDGHGHGTHTTGTMVGDDGGTNQIGMAPGAQTVHCKNMTNSGSGSEATFTECFQWDLAPWDLNQQYPDPAKAPDAINNSWGHSGGNQNQYRDEILALQAAGIAVEVSAGNEGSGCASLRSPGDYNEVLTTGSVNHANPYPGTITGFSSRGPSDLDPSPPNYFPDIMAPGENIRSCLPGNAYASWGGTSMAGPHATALIGLLWSACPSMQGMVYETYQIIKDTAVPLSYVGSCGGDYVTGPNNDWGYGTIDALAAVNEILNQCGPTGALEGYVTDAVTTDPIEGAVVTVDSWTQATDDTGYYFFPMIPEGTYDVTAEHPQYQTGLNPGVVIVSGTTAVSDFDLQPMGRLLGHVYDADNGFPLEGATVTADDGTLDETDAAGYYEMYLDEGTYVVTATMPDYADGVATVEIISATDTVQDFYLQAAVVFIPSPLHVTVTWQMAYNEAATLTNRMAGPYDFEFREKPGGYLPSGGVLYQPPSLGTTGPVAGGTIADNPPPDWFDDSPPAPRHGIEAWALGTPIPSGAQFGNPMATADGINFYLMGGLTSGGQYLNQTLHYDTASGVWTTMANMPTARNNTHAFYSPYDGKIYVPGGYLSGAYIPNFDAYDPASNTWQTLAPLPTGKVGVQGGVVGNKVYVLGGNNSPTTCYAYDIDAGTWNTCAPLPVANYYGSEAVYEDMIYVIGGWTSANFLRYDPATDTWEQGPSLPVARNSPAAAVSTDGILYIWGGGNGWTPYYDGLYYDLANWPGGSWTPIVGDDMPDRNIRAGYACTGSQFWNTGGGPQASAVATNKFWDGMECYFPGGAGPDVPWFAQDPVAGTVPGTLLGDLNPTMYFTATPDVGVNQPGDYYCDLIVNGTPKLTVRVTMTVEPSADLGQVHGYVRDNCTGAPLEEVLVEIAGGLITETLTGPDGYYSAWLYAGTYQVDFSLAGYLGQSHMVTITADESVVLDVDLVPDHPCIAVEPDMFEVWLVTGTAVYTDATGLDITNDGGQDLNVSVMEIDGGFTPPPLAGWKPAPLPGVYNPDAVADVVGAEPVAATPPVAAPVQGYVPEAVLYDNGPLVTHPGGGFGGADASALQTALGLNTYGFGHQFTYQYRMADDFVVDHPSGWQIDAITFFAYQTGSPTNPSPITGVYYQIWDGPPNDPGSSVIFGDLTTNRLVNTTWSNIYRVLDTGLGDTTRPIMADTCSAGLQLPAGTYWIEWMTDGSLTSGPWAPPISILGQTTTGNALQYTTAWAPALDTGTSTQQGMPFVIEGMLMGGDVPWFWEVPTHTVVPATSMDNLGIYFTALYPDMTPMPLGTYTATMMLMNNAGDPVEIPVTMHIMEQVVTPTADFTATTPVCPGEEIWFYFTGDPGNPAADQYTWDFGDGISMTVGTPDPVGHLYGAPGIYTVTLEVCITAWGACDTTTGQVEVLEEIVAGFDYTMPACVGLDVTFTNTTTGSGPFTWLWDFGDGITDTVESPVHAYDAVGLYTATLTAWGACNDDQASAVIDVLPLPAAAFTYTADMLTVTFTDLSQNATAWLWDFGDGATSTETNPIHTYLTGGTYAVSLTVTGPCGVDTTAMDITVIGLYYVYIPLIFAAYP